jgi:hypothetical protein
MPNPVTDEPVLNVIEDEELGVTLAADVGGRPGGSRRSRRRSQQRWLFAALICLSDHDQHYLLLMI